MSLLDTPLRKSLTEQSTHLRAALKDFERDFFASHNRRPGRDDIKQNEDVAAKYKQYNKVRDVLSGKLSKSKLENHGSPAREPNRKSTAGVSSTPCRTQFQANPRKPLGQLRPDELDPYDAPSSISPRRKITALGPTPQRDGRVMGIFDMLDASASGTCSSKKRKLSTLLQNERLEDGPSRENAAGSQEMTAATPGRSRSKPGPPDILDHLSGTPDTSRHNKHSRTPASEGRKFMLNQFFATPSAVRYASMLKDPGADELMDGPAMLTDTPQAKADGTPLLDRVLGRTPVRASETKTRTEEDAGAEGEKTPAYLKRSHSFKQRLLSASTSGSAVQQRTNKTTSALDMSPDVRHSGPRHLIKSRFNPRPLSLIAHQMKERETEEALRRAQNAERLAAEAAVDDDELDALREIEVNGDTRISDTQIDDDDTTFDPANGKAETQPARKWKKKGQKRTTRRVIMRPSKVKIQDPKYRPEEAYLNDDGAKLFSLNNNNNEADFDSQDQVEETQLQPSSITIAEETFSDDELLAEIFANSDDELFGVRAISKSPAPTRTGELRLDADPDDLGAGDSDDDAQALEWIESEAKDEDGDADFDSADAADEPELLSKSKPKRANTKTKTKTKSIKRTATASNATFPTTNPNRTTKSSARKPAAATAGATSVIRKTRAPNNHEDEDLHPRKINPNAQSHMNFRSLKIRNKNSKARQGRGRFGGGKGRR